MIDNKESAKKKYNPFQRDQTFLEGSPPRLFFVLMINIATRDGSTSWHRYRTFRLFATSRRHEIRRVVSLLLRFVLSTSPSLSLFRTLSSPSFIPDASEFTSVASRTGRILIYPKHATVWVIYQGGKKFRLDMFNFYTFTFAAQRVNKKKIQ